MRIILLDNTILSNFALVTASDLVLNLWGEACVVTEAVWQEYQVGVSQRQVPLEWLELRQVDLTAREEQWLQQLPPRLGLGESSSLAVAYHRQGLLATDDWDARRTAAHFSIPISGTLGILIAQIKLGYLSNASKSITSSDD